MHGGEAHISTQPAGPDDNNFGLIGQVLNNSYEVESVIAKGGMGVVYRAKQRSTGQPVAIKVVLPSQSGHDGEETTKRFIREVKILCKLQHIHIVSTIDFGETDNGLIFLVMEHIQGRTLKEVLDRDGPLSSYRVLRIALQICDALQHAHAEGILHRDLKPSNIMLLEGKQDNIKLIDFGIGKAIGPDISDDTLTAADMVIGTPRYVAPEVLAGQPASSSSDLYALGLIMRELVSNTPSFVGQTGAELIHKILSGEFEPMPSVPPSPLDFMIERLVHSNPAKRYPSPEALILEIESHLTSNLTIPAGFGQDLTVEPKKSKAPLWAGLFLALATGVFSLWHFGAGQQDRRPEQSAEARTAPPPVGIPSRVTLGFDSSSPSEVYLDGTKLGRTPFEKSFEKNTEELEFLFKAEGFKEERRSIVPQKPHKISVTLSKLPSPRSTRKKRSVPRISPKPRTTPKVKMQAKPAKLPPPAPKPPKPVAEKPKGSAFPNAGFIIED